MSASAPFVGTRGGGRDSIDAEFTVARRRKIRQKVLEKLNRIVVQIAPFFHVYPYP
jgi:hypothetical protein